MFLEFLNLFFFSFLQECSRCPLMTSLATFQERDCIGQRCKGTQFYMTNVTWSARWWMVSSHLMIVDIDHMMCKLVEDVFHSTTAKLNIYTHVADIFHSMTPVVEHVSCRLVEDVFHFLMADTEHIICRLVEDIFHFMTTDFEHIICMFVDDVFHFMTAHLEHVMCKHVEGFFHTVTAEIQLLQLHGGHILHHDSCYCWTLHFQPCGRYLPSTSGQQKMNVEVSSSISWEQIVNALKMPSTLVTTNIQNFLCGLVEDTFHFQISFWILNTSLNLALWMVSPNLQSITLSQSVFWWNVSEFV